MEFAKEFFDYVVNNDKIGIAGGNDNQYEHEKVNYGGTPLVEELPRDYGSHNRFMISRKDGDYWTIFNNLTGTKIRMSFTTDKPYQQAKRPELVDVKITDFCPYGCQFCADVNTNIRTKDGNSYIQDIKIGDTVFAYDLNKGQLVETKVEEVFERDYKGEMIGIELEDGTILSVTPEHEIYTKRGWIVAGEITDEDEVIKY